ncbi:MAG: phage portal protein [Candidatus Thiodiazotropha sp. (ex Troendleina suluensis)]|nr:phage portal protein [Candidatus Thiodiazotropha sp. (ex Troendleina suluensis)]
MADMNPGINQQSPPQIVDTSGRPLVSMTGAHRAARFDHDMLSYAPPLRSADADLLPDMRTMVSRALDQSRNYPMVSGANQIHLDNIIGSGLRLSAKPDYRWLGLDAEWAAEWSRDVELFFRNYVEDPDCWIDASRRLTFGAMLGLAYRQYLTTGDILASTEWLPRRNAALSTAIQMIDPARLSNPHGLADANKLRGGVEMDRMGAPIAYHIRSAMEGDNWFYGADTYSWKRVSRETKWGRAKIIHIFEQERPGQSRGKSRLASVIAKGYGLEKFHDVSLEASIINSMYAAVIETEFNFAQAAQALDATDLASAANGVLSSQQAFQKGSQAVQMGGVKIPHLYPGERFNFMPSNHPGPNFAEFEKAFNRHMAAGQNLPYEMYARDYSETNYSGARAGLQEAWKFFTSRRELIGGRFATQVYTLVLEEGIDKGHIKLPPGSPDFYQGKAAYTRCRWIGPGKGQIDPLKESKADELEMDMGTLTLEEACARRGLDWQENLEQIAREQAFKEQMGIKRTDEQRGYNAPEAPAA